MNYTEDSSHRLKCFCLKENAVPLDTVLWLLPDQLHFPGLIHISSGQNVRYTHCSELQTSSDLFIGSELFILLTLKSKLAIMVMQH